MRDQCCAQGKVRGIETYDGYLPSVEFSNHYISVKIELLREHKYNFVVRHVYS